ncbi:MAG: AI-2E family transporter [Flavobacteriaceae bacterium]|nr:AI-2E family transporter [Flavobacteriaceae bacterium]
MKKSILKGNPIDTYIRIITLTILLVASYSIVKPFLLIIIWSALVAVALYPFYLKIINLFKGKKKGLVTSVFIIILLALIVVPTVSISKSIVSSSVEFKEGFEAGTLKIPPPNDSVKEWPLIGEKTYTLWLKANQNIEKFVLEYKEQVGNLLGGLFGKLTGLVGTVFLALFSLIIAGVFMSSADGGYQTSVKFANRIMPGKGEGLVTMVTSTIRSVVKGILVVSIIQAGLAYLGFVVVGLPGAELFALLVLIMAIIQLPPILAIIPAIAIVASSSDSNTTTIIFTIYSILVSMSDSFLKPILLGKGLQTPMLVILIGALGGMMFMGMLGLFIGPVILAIAFQIYNAWVSEVKLPDPVEKVVEE